MFEAGHHIFWLIIAVMLIGLYIVMANENLIKKVLGLNIFQAGVFLLYIGIGKVTGGTAPILAADSAKTAAAGAELVYSNPLPHVLILTAIVVGVATTALALAMIVRIYAAYGTLEEDEMDEQDVREDDEHTRAARAHDQP